MIRYQLCAALGFQKDKSTPVENYTYRVSGEWHICSLGPGYCNVYKLVEFDADGLAWLEKKERKGSSDL